MMGCIYPPLDEIHGINREGEFHVIGALRVFHAAYKLAPIILIRFPYTGGEEIDSRLNVAACTVGHKQ